MKADQLGAERDHRARRVWPGAPINKPNCPRVRVEGADSSGESELGLQRVGRSLSEPADRRSAPVAIGVLLVWGAREPRRLCDGLIWPKAG